MKDYPVHLGALPCREMTLLLQCTLAYAAQQDLQSLLATASTLSRGAPATVTWEFLG
ncbi:MAG: hypothetical protein K2Y28_05540 [Burkholderiaceae bacterium]|nr:hypothetical protein [Burkholderiaceae bacterium]